MKTNEQDREQRDARDEKRGIALYLTSRFPLLISHLCFLFAHFLAFATYMSPYTRKYAYGEIPEKMREQSEQSEQNPKYPCKIRSFAFNLNVTFERTKIKRANTSRICENRENSENKNQKPLIL